MGKRNNKRTQQPPERQRTSPLDAACLGTETGLAEALANDCNNGELLRDLDVHAHAGPSVGQEISKSADPSDTLAILPVATPSPVTTRPANEAGLEPEWTSMDAGRMVVPTTCAAVALAATDLPAGLDAISSPEQATMDMYVCIRTCNLHSALKNALRCSGTMFTGSRPTRTTRTKAMRRLAGSALDRQHV